LEDDIEFSDDFDKKLQYAMSEFTEKQMDYLYLGANSLRTVNADFDNLKCVRSDGEQGEGTYAYIISKRCAEKLLDYFNKNSMKRAIDFTPVYKSILDGIFYLNESIVHTFSIQHHGVHVDSDIQKDYDFVDMTGVGDLDSDDESCGLYEDYYQANYGVSK
jgi:GR25 family glycosyltransferase involved in LPS biosynthesis